METIYQERRHAKYNINYHFICFNYFKHSPAELINKIKGKLGYELTKTYPHLNTGKGVWSTSYFCATTGNVSSETIKKYIENQMIKMYNL